MHCALPTPIHRASLYTFTLMPQDVWARSHARPIVPSSHPNSSTSACRSEQQTQQQRAAPGTAQHRGSQHSSYISKVAQAVCYHRIGHRHHFRFVAEIVVARDKAVLRAPRRPSWCGVRECMAGHARNVTHPSAEAAQGRCPVPMHYTVARHSTRQGASLFFSLAGLPQCVLG